MEQLRYSFNWSEDQIELENSHFHQNLFDEQEPLLLAVLLIVCITVLPSLISRMFSKRPRVFQIYNNQLNSSSFLPFNYLIIVHLDKGLLSRWLVPSTEAKFRFELLNAKQKRTGTVSGMIFQ